MADAMDTLIARIREALVAHDAAAGLMRLVVDNWQQVEQAR